MVKTIKVFISSPSDVEYERKRAKEIVENLKTEFGEDVVFDVYLYEEHHQTANRGDFQKQINRYLKEADIAIFIVWSRLGSKMSSYVGPVSGKKGVTGTEYEFEMALDLWQKTGKPDILVYWKTKEVALPPQYDSHEYRQKKKALEEVNAFFQTWFKNENNSIERAYFEFEDDDALKAYLHCHIASIVREKRYAGSKIVHPYKGLDSFDFEDRVVFFGRDDDVRTFFERWQEEEAPFVTVFGTSGCGKSSFVKAGLLPHMLKEAHGGFVVMRPLEASQNPFETLAQKLFDIYPRQFEALSYSAEKLQKRLESSDILPLEQVFKSDKVYLVLDQFEEIINIADALQERYFNLLRHCTEELDVVVLTSIRTNSLEFLDEKPFFRAIKRFDYHLTFPSSANMIQLIKKPAELAHLEFDIDPKTGKSLDKIIAEEAMKDPNALPLVEFALTQLEERKSCKEVKEGRCRLTIDAYKKIGELHGAVGTLAQQTFARLNEKEKKIFERLLPNLVTIKENQLILTDYLPHREEKDIVALFVEARLFVQKGEYIRVAHEAFFRYWDFAKKVIEETKSDMIQRERIAEAYRFHEEQKSDKTALLQGSLLFIAEEILKRRGKCFFDNSIEGISGYIEKSINYAKKVDRRKRNFLVGMSATFFTLSIGLGYEYLEAEEKKRLAFDETERANRNERRMKEELEKAEHNLGLALLEKANVALEKGEIEKANLFAYASLLKTKETYDKTNAKARAKSILISYPDRAVSSFVGHANVVNSAAYSPDGKTIISGSIDGTIKIWEVKSFKELYTIKGHKNSVNAVAYSPDGKKIISGSNDDTIKIWDAINFQEIATLKGHKDSIKTVSYSPDGKKIISGSDDDTIKIWDAINFQEIFTINDQYIYNNPIAYAPNNKTFASGTSGDTGGIKIWDAINFKEIATLKGHKDKITSLDYSPDSKKIISGSLDHTIKIWDAINFKEIATLKGHKDKIISVIYAKNGKTIISASSDDTIKMWDTTKYEEIISLKENGLFIQSVIYSPDTTMIISCSLDGTIRVWDATNFKNTSSLEGHKDNVETVIFSTNNKTILSSSSDDTIKIWNVVNFKEIATLEGQKKDVSQISSTPLSYSPNSKTFISGSLDTIKVWDSINFKNIAVLKGHKDIIETITYSPDGKNIISGSEDHTIKVWDSATLMEITSYKLNYGVESIAYAPNGKRIALGLDSGEIKILNTKDFKELITFKGFEDGITSIAYSQDNNTVVSCAVDSSIKVWDAINYKQITTLYGHEGFVMFVTYSHNGKKIISGSTDHTIKIWDAINFKEIATLYGHKDQVNSIATSNDGKIIVSGSDDRTVKIWDMQKLVNLYNSDYIRQNIKRLEQFLQVRLDGTTLKDATIPPLSPKESYPKHHPFHWIDDAENGDAVAMYQLGLIYDRDNENGKALEWYKKALKSGYKLAEERIAFLEKWMAEHPEKPNTNG